MARMSGWRDWFAGGIAAFALAFGPAVAQAAEPPEIQTVLRGLAPVSALGSTPAGQKALAENLRITGAIARGELVMPGRGTLDAQRRNALQDAFITQANGAQLADGFGSRLGPAYLRLAQYQDRTHFTAVAPSLTELIAYTNRTTAISSNAGKFFFANGTTDSRTPVAESTAGILSAVGGTLDVFGKAYGLPAGAPGANRFGNSRPFQVLKDLPVYEGPDYFEQPSRRSEWLEGPSSDLRNNPSYPSGHTTYGTMESVLLGVLLPERYSQQVARGAEYGNSRVVLGAHYAMDVIGGRTLALHELAHLLANDPAYLNRTYEGVRPIADYRAAVQAASADLRAALEKSCGDTVARCAADDTGPFADGAKNGEFVRATLGYGLPVVRPERESATVDVGAVAPEAGYLLTVAFPALSLADANAILSDTLAPGGGFLDDGTAFGLYSRLNLHEAAIRAAVRARSR